MTRETISTRKEHEDYHNCQSESPIPSTLPLPLPSRAMLLVFLKWALKNISQGITRNLLRVMCSILNLLLYITLLLIILTWPTTQYPINIASILGIWEKYYLIQPTDTELIGGYRCTREGCDSPHIRALPKKNFILKHYMISAWWLQLLNRLQHCVICTREIDQVIVTKNNIMALGYNYSKHRLKNPPGILHKLTHTGRVIAWIPSRLSWNQELWWRYRSIQRPRPPTKFTRTNNQEGPTTFDTLRGTLSGTQGALIPSTPNLISIYNTNP